MSSLEQAGPQALLDDRGSHEGHVLTCCGGPRLLDGAFDAVGDEGVGRITCRDRVWDGTPGIGPLPPHASEMS